MFVTIIFIIIIIIIMLSLFSFVCFSLFFCFFCFFVFFVFFVCFFVCLFFSLRFWIFVSIDSLTSKSSFIQDSIRAILLWLLVPAIIVVYVVLRLSVALLLYTVLCVRWAITLNFEL